MTSDELRQRFLAFFDARGHTRVLGDSLIPSGDPTVLFTPAGMNQFKDAFLGIRTDLTRAVSCQKCLRTGDLGMVGRTPSHHSFFEMLGNFSFGDYFKAEAIGWAWEFLTGTLDGAGGPSPDRGRLCLGLPAERLWVSVYEEDEEAAGLWRRLGLPASRILKFGPADNFWPANAAAEGPNGPCGPCSEVYYDPDGAVRGPRSVEVWNLVFTQFDRQPDGSLRPLPRKNIDTGMGLERLARVLQGVDSDYETDLFAPIVARIKAEIGGSDGPEAQRALWTVADHLRAIVFLLAEHLLPSNEGRGYVLRMLIRRAYWHGAQLAAERASAQAGGSLFLTRLAGTVIEGYAPAYGELRAREEFIFSTLETEERRFIETLAAGNAQVMEMCERLAGEGAREVPAEFAFKMKDTYGYPVELLADMAGQHGLAVDRAGFARLLDEQRARSRAGSQFGGGVFVTDALRVREALPDLPGRAAQFLGYDELTADTIVRGLWSGTAWVPEATAGQVIGLVLARSPFYGESGGQIGDTGVIEGTRGRAEVTGTIWADDVLVHQARMLEGVLRLRDPVRAAVDAERRLRVARSHTATHLLHWALRAVLGPDAVQAGSAVEVERLRFDFSSPRALDEAQREEVQALVNRRVRLVDPVEAVDLPLEEARRRGALALFGEKYGRRVRVVEIGGYSKELCGGTHVRHTGYVGPFLIVAESSIAAGTRRVEALVGDAAAERSRREQRHLHEAARRLGRPAQELVAGLEELLEQLRVAERERKALRTELAKVEAERLVAAGRQVDGVTFIASTIKQADREQLAVLADAVKQALERGGVVLLASAGGAEQVSLVMAATSDLAGRIHVGQLLKAIAPLTRGSGGGRAEFAQAGGRDPAGIPAAFKRAEELVRAALTAR